MGQGHARHTQAHVGLVAPATVYLDQTATHIVGCLLPVQRILRFPVLSGLCKHVNDFIVGHVPSHRHHRVGRVVLLVHILSDILLLDIRNRLKGSADIPAHGLVRPHGLVNQQVNTIGRLVICHT